MICNCDCIVLTSPGSVDTLLPAMASLEGPQLRAVATGLLFACPCEGDNPPDCQACALRLRPVNERVAWLQSQTDEDVAAFYQRHMQCLRRKEAASGQSWLGAR